MPTIFTRILSGEFPGRFVYRDDRCAAFLTIAPMKRGHTLVVPIQEVDHWLDLEPALAAHLMQVAQRVGAAQMRAFKPLRIGLMIAGLEVPHVHLHVVPMDEVHDLDFSRADSQAQGEALDQAAELLRAEMEKGE